MLKAYTIIGIVLIMASGFFLACQQKNQPTEMQKDKQTESMSEQQENSFHDLREMALRVTPEQLGIENHNEANVFGIVLDWDLGDGIATIVAYETGDASMYLSSGGGIIGGGQHDNVRQAALSYIALGQGFLSKAKKTESIPLPDRNCIRFYFLTSSGTYFAQEEWKNIESETSEWFMLFEKANKVLTELRLATE